MTATAAADTPEGAPDPGLLGRLPFHALLLGAWPALSLWSSNAGEVRPTEAWPFVWLPAAAAVLATAVLTFALRRDPRRAALVVSVLGVATLMGGRVVGVPDRAPTLVALGAAFGVRAGLSSIAGDRRFELFSGFAVDAGQFRVTAVIILFTGVAIGALGSAFAVSRFLDV